MTLSQRLQNMYRSEEFGALSQWLIDLFAEFANGLLEKELERLEEMFLNTTHFEYMFWKKAYSKEMWSTNE